MVWKAVVKLMTMVHCGTAMYRCGLCVTPAAGDISVPGQIGHQTAYHDPMKSCLSPPFCIPIPHLGGQASSLNCHITMAVLIISPHFHHPTPCLLPPPLRRWATLTTNIAANIVGPANAFVNLSPGRVSFNGGALATALLGLVIMPWKLVRSWGGVVLTYWEVMDGATGDSGPTFRNSL